MILNRFWWSKKVHRWASWFMENGVALIVVWFFIISVLKLTNPNTRKEL